MAGISTYAQTLRQIDQLGSMQINLADLQRQLATGKKAAFFNGLDRGVLTSQRARADTSKIDTFINNIDVAKHRMNVMTNSIEEIKTQTEFVQNALANQTQEGDTELGQIAPLANNVRNFVEDLLNTQDGDRYLFAGSDVENPPVNLSGSLDSYVQSQIDDWINGNIDTDTLISNYKDPEILTDATIGYSNALSNDITRDVSVRVDDSAEIDYTVRANSSGFRDVLVITSMILSLEATIDKASLDEGDLAGDFVTAPGGSQQEQNDNFYGLFSDLTAQLNTAIGNMSNDGFKIAQSQRQINVIRNTLSQEQNMMKAQIASVEDSNINEIAVSLSALQTQLEASYSVTATVARLSLVNFL